MKNALKVIGVVSVAIFFIGVYVFTLISPKIAEEEKMFNYDY